MHCPNCGASIHLEDGACSSACEYCHAVYLPAKNDDGVRVFNQASDLACPVCREPLRHATLARQRIQCCIHCHGSLIPMPVFVVLIDVLRARRGPAVEIAPAPDRRQLDRTLHCPKCGHRMDTHFYAGGGNVAIDENAGEFMAIVRAPDHSLESALEYGDRLDVE